MIAVVCARLGSGRLPGKVMYGLAGKPALWHVLKRLVDSGLFESVVLARSSAAGNEVLDGVALSAGVLDDDIVTGADEDVVSRFHDAMLRNDSRYAVRFCADNPLPDLESAERIVLARDCDYATISDHNLNLGICERLSFRAVQAALADSHDRESFTLCIQNNPEMDRELLYPTSYLNQSKYRLTLDNPDDYAVLSAVFDSCGQMATFRDAIDFLEHCPGVAGKNLGNQLSEPQKRWMASTSSLKSARTTTAA